eukprot:TRINITY_DN16933_c0_g1_i1.p1 TRINITY_DN16933_c0_g1~~TRINITY_DN16933_c0_g1_i1.p1  ORF type:complete len:265 (-),score=57.31 TRINITY_DN16933_c0_g1_i1:74-868(-)
MALDWNSGLFAGLSAGLKINASLFQSISTRFAGFNVVDLNLSSETQKVLEITFMYISAIPTIMTLRSSAVVNEDDEEGEERQQEQKLPQEAKEAKEPNSRGCKLGIWERVYEWYRRRNFLLRQAIILYCLVILITAIESERFRVDPNFTSIKVIFECVSAYGSVGLSFGYPNSALSFSGQFTVISKLIVVLIFMLGRHRGLPTELDAAYSLYVKLTDQPELDDDQANDKTVILSALDVKMIREDAEGQRRTVTVKRTRQVTSLL